MSRAFTREGDGALDPLPDLPQSPYPNYVTPRGLAALQTRLQQRQTNLAALKSRSDRLDKLPEAAAERDIRYLEARLRSAILTQPAPNLVEAAFGHRITVTDPQGQTTTYEITGEDEADAPSTASRRIPPSPAPCWGRKLATRSPGANPPARSPSPCKVLPMPIRKLDAIADRALVDAFFQPTVEYIRLERDAAPTPKSPPNSSPTSRPASPPKPASASACSTPT